MSGESPEEAVAQAVAQDPEAGEEPVKELSKNSSVTGTTVYPMREISIGPLKFNWLVSILGLGVLWGIAIFCMASPDASTVLARWYGTTIRLFTWFYILGKILYMHVYIFHYNSSFPLCDTRKSRDDILHLLCGIQIWSH